MSSESILFYSIVHGLTLVLSIVTPIAVSSSSKLERSTRSGPLELSLRFERRSAIRLATCRSILTFSIRLCVPFSLPSIIVLLAHSLLEWNRKAAPATGTPETGGWSTRELRTIIRGLEGLMIVGADVSHLSLLPLSPHACGTALCQIH